jgi:type VI secretion system protein ImpL
MTTKRRLAVVFLLFFAYVLIVWLAAFRWSSGATFWLFTLGLTAVGLIALTVYFSISRLISRHAPAAPQGEVENVAAQPSPARTATLGDTSLAGLIREAGDRLSKSPMLASRRTRTSFTDLPLYILAGPAGAGKTNTFLASALSPQLLAGQVHRESTVLPTSLCNLWFASDAIFAEAGGRFFTDDVAQWRSLVEHLCAGAGSSLLQKLRAGRRPDANLRGVVWFCEITPFLGIPDLPRIDALARKVQERMLTLGEVAGSDFPVYVVFTKADQLPHFGDFVHRMSDREDGEVLGCTLPASNLTTSGGVYAEAQTQRLLDPFNRLYASLTGKRLALLAREPDGARKPGVYEFPREVKRIRDSLIHFLVEAFRRNPLQPGPLLRGFYFTGVREVPLAAAGAPGNGAARRQAGADATLLFNAADEKLSAPALSAATGGAGTVPRWTFAAKLFPTVILRDPLGGAVAVRNIRRDLRNRILLGAAIAAGLILSVGLIGSWWGNRSLLNAVERAALVDFSRAGRGAVPSPADLRSMDRLRQALAPLLASNRGGAPWRLRWGLYSGNRVLNRAHDAYFQLFYEWFFAGTQKFITDRLARLGPRDGSASYNAVYDALKAYRMTTSGACSLDAGFLLPVFGQLWQSGWPGDGESRSLMERQVRFYAAELERRNPYSKEENPELVERGRAFLSASGGVDRLFRGMIEAASRAPRRPSRIADLAPGFRQVLSGPGEVQGAFTREGWAYVEQAIREPGSQSLGEGCVLGSDSRTGLTAGMDTARVASQLSALYTRAYIQAWKEFTASTAVQPFRSPAEAAHRLEMLGDNRSPLLAAMFLIADNTVFPMPAPAPSAGSSSSGLLDRILPVAAKKAVAATQTSAEDPSNSTAEITRIFQPAREVVRPGNRDRLVDDSNRAYINALGDMQRAIERLQNDPPSNPDLALHEQALRTAENGLDAVRQIAQRFNINGAEGVDIEIKRLLESPFRNSMRFIITDPGKAMKDKLGGAIKLFCARVGPLEHKFPFNPQSDADATADEVATVFAPPSGALFLFEQQLGTAVVRQGRYWIQNPQAPEPRLSPELLSFLNSMTAISEALFPNGSPQMRMRYGLRPQPRAGVESIALEIDGEKLTVAAGQSQARLFDWPGPNGAQQVLIRVKAGANIPFASYEGMWGMFRVLADADPRAPGSRTIELSKVRRGHGRPESVLDQNDRPIQVKLEITELPAGIDVFDANFFRLRCPSR